MAATTWKMNGSSDPTATEAFRIYLAQEFATNCGFRDLVFESDCERNIKILNENEDIPNTYVGNVIRGIQCRAMNFRHVAFRHVGRKGNGAAHKLTHYAISEPNLIWLEETPPVLCLRSFGTFLINKYVLVFSKK